METIKKGWVQWLITCCISILIFVAAKSIEAKKESKSGIRIQIEAKADKSYVDQQDAQIKETIEKGDDNIKEYFDQYKEQQLEWQRSQDAKWNILLSRIK